MSNTYQNGQNSTVSNGQQNGDSQASPHQAPVIQAPAIPQAGGAHPLAPAMMASYTALMEKFLETQRDVMLAVLGAEGSGQLTVDSSQLAANSGQSVPAPLAYAPPPVPVVVAPAPIAAPAPTVISQPVAPAAANGAVVSSPSSTPLAPSSPAASEEATPEAMQAALIAIISDRTGYPEEMIEPDLDLEGDLGIDSIKRVEILGAFQKRFGDVVDADSMDDLTMQKSLRDIVEFIEANK